MFVLYSLEIMMVCAFQFDKYINIFILMCTKLCTLAFKCHLEKCAQIKLELNVNRKLMALLQKHISFIQIYKFSKQEVIFRYVASFYKNNCN